MGNGNSWESKEFHARKARVKAFVEISGQKFRDLSVLYLYYSCFISGNSYDLTKKEYAKLLKIKEDIEKQEEKLENSYSRMYDIFSSLQDNYTN